MLYIQNSILKLVFVFIFVCCFVFFFLNWAIFSSVGLIFFSLKTLREQGPNFRLWFRACYCKLMSSTSIVYQRFVCTPYCLVKGLLVRNGTVSLSSVARKSGLIDSQLFLNSIKSSLLSEIYLALLLWKRSHYFHFPGWHHIRTCCLKQRAWAWIFVCFFAFKEGSSSSVAGALLSCVVVTDCKCRLT